MHCCVKIATNVVDPLEYVRNGKYSRRLGSTLNQMEDREYNDGRERNEQSGFKERFPQESSICGTCCADVERDTRACDEWLEACL